MAKSTHVRLKDLRIKLSKEGIFSKSGIPFVKLVYVSVLINISIILLIVLLRNKIPPEAPLFYGLARGERQLTTTIGLTIPSIISLTIIIINTVISYIIDSDYLKKVLIITGIASTLLSAITTIKIFLLVGTL